MVPKAELHVHLEGTATPDLVRRIAARNGLPVPDGVFAAPDRFAWRDFLDFLRTYDLAASVIRTGAGLPRHHLRVPRRLRAPTGAIYVELIASPDHARPAGLSDAEHWEGIAAGHRRRARATTASRRASSAWRSATSASSAPIEIAEHTAVAAATPTSSASTLAGDEAGYPPGPFAEAYEIAAAAGLGCTVHAGEQAGADSVRGALELPVTRISHGVRAIEDPALVAELAERGDRARGLPDQQRRPRRLPELRGPPLRRRCARPACRSRSAPTTRRISALASAASTRWRASTSALSDEELVGDHAHGRRGELRGARIARRSFSTRLTNSQRLAAVDCRNRPAPGGAGPREELQGGAVHRSPYRAILIALILAVGSSAVAACGSERRQHRAAARTSRRLDVDRRSPRARRSRSASSPTSAASTTARSTSSPTRAWSEARRPSSASRAAC